MTPKDYKLLLRCIGWNSRTWAVPTSKILDKTGLLERKNLKVLELGAGRASSLGVLFLRNANEVTISYFDKSNYEQVAECIDTFPKDQSATYKLQLVQASILGLRGTYDVIIMKSVLGGVFRTDQPEQNINGFLETIVANNLTENGVLITIDNGLPFYARLINNLGARGARWRFFKPHAFSGASVQSCFGLFGAFSIKMRLGYLGELLEGLTYCADSILCGVYKKAPTVIASAYFNTPYIADPKDPE